MLADVCYRHVIVMLRLDEYCVHIVRGGSIATLVMCSGGRVVGSADQNVQRPTTANLINSSPNVAMSSPRLTRICARWFWTRRADHNVANS